MVVDKSIAEKVIAHRQKIIEEESRQVDACFRSSGKYVETKLKYIRGYLYIYTKILNKYFPDLWYIEPEAGPGFCEINSSGRKLLGSPFLALSNQPRFQHYRFIEKDENCAQELDKRVKKYFPDLDALIIPGDCNEKLSTILESIPSNAHVLSIIDPKGLEFRMSTMELYTNKERHELYINYPYNMAILRCISPKGYQATQKTVTEYYGDESWKPIRDDLYNGIISNDESREKFLQLYVDKIKKLGFSKVSISNVIVSDANRPLYYLIHACNKSIANKTMNDVMKIGQKNKIRQEGLFD
jgi:three-Cys-motif partner protein